MTIAAQDFANELDGASAVALTLGTNLFWGPIRAAGTRVPKNSVFVFSGAGAEPQRFMGRTSEIRSPIIHIRVRNAKSGSGANLAQDLVDYLQDVTIVGYLDVKALQSEPNFLGQDDDGTNLWTMSYELTREVNA